MIFAWGGHTCQTPFRKVRFFFEVFFSFSFPFPLCGRVDKESLLTLTRAISLRTSLRVLCAPALLQFFGRIFPAFVSEIWKSWRPKLRLWPRLCLPSLPTRTGRRCTGMRFGQCFSTLSVPALHMGVKHTAYRQRTHACALFTYPLSAHAHTNTDSRAHVDAHT